MKNVRCGASAPSFSLRISGRRRASLLGTSTRLGSAIGTLALLASPTLAQTVVPDNFVAPYFNHADGAPVPNSPDTGGNAPVGGTGNDAAALDLLFHNQQSLALYGAVPTILVTSNGSAGGNGGSSLANGFGDGGTGGNGGASNTVAFAFDDGLISNLGTGSLVVATSQGGAGGGGGNSSNSGLDGAGGLGMAGNTVNFSAGAANDAAANTVFTGLGPVAAIVLTSAGGNGGDVAPGGDSYSSGGATGPQGGHAGNGGLVNGFYDAVLTSEGSGIVAVSSGGNGGLGGNASGLASSHGGNGGDAGSGAGVDLQFLGGTISAIGAANPATGAATQFDVYDPATNTFGTGTGNVSVLTTGVLAASFGGTGGFGGSAQGNFGGADGGKGGAAGAGGTITLAFQGTAVATTGYSAVAVMGLSVGGGGGTGAAANGGMFRHGGRGAEGGFGGAIGISLGNETLTGYKIVSTSGADSDAVVGMSIGGGGGYGGDVSGGTAGISISLGGAGAVGGDGGAVGIGNGYWLDGGINSAFMVPGYVISTTGDYSRALVAASVGGGGGRGGDASSIDLGIVSMSIGGQGGSGGDGGGVEIVNYGVLQTRGIHSTGVDIQSVGGGGGSGGAASSLVIGTQLTVAVSVGGSGGTGGDGGDVVLENFGQIITGGSDAYGVVAQSVGGGGGHGGASVATNLQANPPETPVPAISLTSSVGGKGGKGGVGGQARLLNTGLVLTQGQGAIGMFAQSVGGGGGTGGDSTDISAATTAAAITVTTSVGGSGGSGGLGGEIQMWNAGLVWTLGDAAPGMVGQSVGGGGGIGGFANANTDSVGSANGPSLQVTVSVGGNGGKGGDGGAVNIFNFVDATSTLPPVRGAPNQPNLTLAPAGGGIITFGDQSDGIFAQSTGGGGGWGGNGSANGSNGQVNVNVAVGGNGGNGGDGGQIIVDNGVGVIVTAGASSAGIFAQTVGGGGGRGGSASTGGGKDPLYQIANYAAQGMGTTGNTINNIGQGIWELQINAVNKWNDADTLNNIVDGYDALNSGSPVPTGAIPSAVKLDVDIGGGWSGTGGTAGNGGVIYLGNKADILTGGPQSAGMFAQSVGGGGGQGGATNVATSDDTSSPADISGTLSVGGHSGAGGDGGLIEVGNTGTITTLGDLSPGMQAQSVGGGGGQGGMTYSRPGLQVPTNINSVLNLAFGGSGGASGNGGSVQLANTGSIVTVGDDSIGMMAQSIGGGGGQISVMTLEYDPVTGKMISQAGAAGSGTVAAIRISATSGVNAEGGPAIIILGDGSSISTAGQDSYGVLAQSIGSSGGIINAATNSADASNIFDYTVTSQDEPYGSGNGGTVTVTAGVGTISTSGNGAVGILAQSVGGGGGIIGGMYGARNGIGNGQSVYSGDPKVSSGFGGNILVTNEGTDIVTTGEYAHGIFAQSISEGGGVIGHADGSGYVFSGHDDSSLCGSDCTGNITIQLNRGSISVGNAGIAGLGRGSYGVFAQSEGIDTATIIVNVGADTTITAVGLTAGGIFLGGPSNLTVNIAGVVDTSLSLANTAITSYSDGTAQVAISAGGVMKGGVNALKGWISVNNVGTIEMGDMQLGGVGGAIVNNGIISAGASGKVAATKITGDFIQGAAGTLVVDTDLITGKADMVTITGKADIGGTIHVQPVTVTNKSLIVLSATGGVTLRPALATTDDTQLFSFAPKISGNALLIQTNANFTALAAPLGRSQRNVAASLQSLFDTGASMDRGFNALSKVNTAAGYASSLNVLSGQTLGAIAAFRFSASHSFVASLYSGCGSFDKAGAVADEANCGWARMVGSSTRQDATGDALGYTATTGSFQLGGQREVADHWYVSGSLAYEMSKFTGDDHSARITGSSLLAGAYVRYHKARVMASVAVDSGYGWYDSKRAIAIGDTSGTALASPKAWHAGLHARLGYEVPLGASAYARPFVDGHAVYVRSRAYTETGASPFNLAVESQGNTALAGAVGIELGSRIALKNGGFVRPFASAAFEALNGNDWSTTARFADQGGSQAFRALTPAPDRLGKFAAGLDIVAARNVDLSLTYTPEVGTGYVSHAGVARLAFRF